MINRKYFSFLSHWLALKVTKFFQIFRHTDYFVDVTDMFKLLKAINVNFMYINNTDF